MKINILSILLLGIFLAGCTAYETQFEGPYEDGQSSAPINVTYEIAYAQSGVLWLSSANLRYRKQLYTPVTAEKVAINYSHDRIAYKAAGGNINIIDSAGTNIANVTGSSDAVAFDFHPNNETIYWVSANGTLKQFGPVVSVAATNLKSVVSVLGSLEIRSVAIRPDGGLVIGWYANQDFSGFQIYGPSVATYPDYRVNTQFRVVQNLRLNADGTKAVTSLSNGGLVSGYEFLVPDQTGQYTSTWASADLVAISPDGTQQAYWSQDNNTIFIGGSNNQIQAAFLTDLDW
jgi:hypothetical protein